MGVPELFVIGSIGMFWLLPLAVAIWVVLTLYRIRVGQAEMRQRLEAIERLLQGS